MNLCRIRIPFLSFILFSFQLLGGYTEWTPPTTLGLSTLGGTRETPRIVSDANGNAAAAWIQSVDIGDTDRAVFVSFYQSGGGWEAATPLESGLVSGNDVDLCIDDQGNVTVAWTIGVAPSLVHSVYRPYGASSWGTIQTVADPGGGIDTYTSIRVACTEANTRAVVVWIESGSGLALTNFRSGSSNWLFAPAAPVSLPNSGTALGSPIVKMKPDGTAQALYMVTGIPGANKLFYSEATTPGVWSSEIDLGIDNTMTIFTFDTNSSGDAIAIARNAASLQTVTRVNGTWGTPQTQTGITNPIDFQIGLDDHGLATGLWQLSSTSNTISYNSFNISAPVTTTSWIPIGTTPPSITSSFTIENPRLAVSPNGNLLILWREDSTTDPIFGRIGANGTLGIKTTLIDTNTQPIAATISNTGRSFALWTDLSGLKLPEVAETYDSTLNLLRALGKKRFINQKTLYP